MQVIYCIIIIYLNLDIYNMEITEQDGQFLVKNGEEILYVAKTLAEAEGYIKWKTRVGATDSGEQCF